MPDRDLDPGRAKHADPGSEICRKFTCKDGGPLHLVDGVGGEGLGHLPEDGGRGVPPLPRAGQGQVTMLHTLHTCSILIPNPLSACLSVCLPVIPTVILLVCLSVFSVLSVRSSVGSSVHTSVCLPVNHCYRYLTCMALSV